MQHITQGTVFRFERAAGTRITVHVGCVWITESGEPDDVFLSARQLYVVVGSGRVLIEPQDAGAGATVDIRPANRRPPPFKPVQPWGDRVRLRHV